MLLLPYWWILNKDSYKDSFIISLEPTDSRTPTWDGRVKPTLFALPPSDLYNRGKRHTVRLRFDDGDRCCSTLAVISTDEAAVRQHVQRVTGTELATTHDTRETVDVVDDVIGRSTYQVTRWDCATAAGTLHTVSPAACTVHTPHHITSHHSLWVSMTKKRRRRR